MLSSALEASPVPGVDVACNAMYLSLVGEVPETYCPPGCTLHATTRGTIYVLDHVHRIGYPLQLTSPMTTTASAAPPNHTVHPAATMPTSAWVPQQQQQQYMTVPDSTPVGMPQLPALSQHPLTINTVTNCPLGQAAAAAPVYSYKRSRASSTDSCTPSSSHQVWERCPWSPNSADPTTPRNDNRDDGDGASQPSSVHPSKKGMSMKSSPQFCLIPPRQRWLEDIYFTLQLGSQWVHRPDVTFYCHFCRVFFAATPTGLWYHLSNPKGHRLQRQRVRGYMVSGNRLLKSPEERILRVTTPEEIRSVPAKHFAHADRLQNRELMHFVPACVRFRSIMNPEQRERVVRDGTAAASSAIKREDLLDSTPQSFLNEPPQLVGWRFLMEGLDIGHCYCGKTNSRLMEEHILGHHKEDKK